MRKLLSALLLLCPAIVPAQNKPPAATNARPTDYTAMGAPMPPILLTLLDSIDLPVQEKPGRRHGRHHAVRTNVITDKDLDNGANLMVMMFNPNCGHCEDQTDRIEQDSLLFRKTRLILMANSSMKEYIPNFVRAHRVKAFPFIYLGMDYNGFTKQTFLYTALPQINIYDADRKLIKTFTGEVLMDSIRAYIQ